MRKKYTIPLIAAAAMAGAIFLGANFASADSEGESTLVDKLVTKFNLNKEEVQAVFDEHHEERKAEMDQRRASDLQAKVDDGTITAEQKTLIENKLKEMDTQREALRDQDLTRDQMREKMQALHDELETWAEDNNINLEDIMPMGGPGGHRGMGEGRGF